MWKHVLVAASFDQAWATTNPVTGLAGATPPVLADMDQAATVAATLESHLLSGEAAGTAGPALAGGMSISVATGSAVASSVGVSGVLNLTVGDLASFLSQDSANKIALEAWLTTKLTDAPHASVEVTIPIPPTTTLPPATSAPTEDGNVTAQNLTDTPPPPSGDPVPALVSTTFVVTLPPGKAEIAERLTNVLPADLFTAVARQLPAGLVTGASFPAALTSTTNVAGSLRLETSNTTLIESVANQGHIRTAIASLAHVFVGDVGAITITSADATPIAPEPVADTVGANVENTRRLTAGTVNAAFTIAVPGLRAQGWQKDCSLQKIVLAPLSTANQFSTVGTAPNEVDATPASCLADLPQTSIETWSWDSSTHTCSLSNLAALSGATFSSTSITSLVGDDACGACPTTIEDPALWPGADAAASHAAFGVGGRQPVNLQCWPKNSNFDMMPCGHVVVEEYSVGGAWAGRCNNLVLTTQSARAADASVTPQVPAFAGVDTTQALCQASCEADPFCTVWQWSSLTSNASDAQCFRGAGNECWTATDDRGGIATLVASQRIQHGEVNVIKDNLTTRVLENLQKQFGENIGATVNLLNSADAQKEACRKICHSNIMCSYWQSFYDAGQGADLGCWTENPGVDAAGAGTFLASLVHYPLTLAPNEGFAATSTERDEEKLTGGQFIQHHCTIPTLPNRIPATTTTAPPAVVVTALPLVPAAPPSGGFMNPWGYILIALGLLAAVGLIVAMVFCQPKPVKPKSTRAVKPIAKKEPPPPPPQPVVPLMAQQILVQPTIPQPLAMTTIQQPMTTVAAQAVAQPMMAQQTYAGAPQFMQRPY